METDKFREKIQQRTITPSQGSWNQLEDQLNSFDQNNRDSNHRWIKYVASIIVILGLGFYWTQSDNILEPDEINSIPVIVNSSEKNITIDSDKEIQIKTITNPVSDTKVAANYSQTKNYKHSDLLEEDNQKSRQLYLGSTELQGEANDSLNQANLYNNINPPYSAEDEVESLLQNSRLQLADQYQIIKKPTINSSDLLEEIEEELKRDTRRKLFEKIVIPIKNPSNIELTDRIK